MLDFDKVSTFSRRGATRSYSLRDSCLYGLSVSPGIAADDAFSLDLALETRGPITLPTMATVLAESLSRFLGLDMRKVVHAQQQLICHQPLPPAGKLVIDGRVSSIVDKGAEKGALVTFENVGRLAGEDKPLFSLANTLFARGDGGFGRTWGEAPRFHAIPEREPDIVHRTASRPDQALLYRLNGDLNPLHAEPAFAEKAGFARPILHGLCTYGMACRAIAAGVLGGNPAAMRTFDVRFTAPFYPGETLVTQVWHDNGELAFRCLAAERDIVVLDNGRCALSPA